MGTGELSGKLDGMLGVKPCDGLVSYPKGGAILLFASCYGKSGVVVHLAREQL